MWHIWKTGEVHTQFWLGDLKEGHHLEDPNGDNIEMYLQEMEWGGVDWIDLAQNRDIWRALVNVIVQVRVPYSVLERRPQEKDNLEDLDLDGRTIFKWIFKN